MGPQIQGAATSARLRRRLAGLGCLAAAALGTAGLVVGGPGAVATAGSGSHDGGSHDTNGQLVLGKYAPKYDDTVLYTINPDGSHRRRVLDQPFECPHWSPDGSVISTCGTVHGNGTALIDPDTGHFDEVLIPSKRLGIACPVWSPDGRRLACEAWGEKNHRLTGIYTVRASDGRDRIRLTANRAGGSDIPGSYSPNGHRLVFQRGLHGDAAALFTVGIDGSDLRRISTAGRLVSSVGDWSARHNLIVFSRHLTPDLHSTMWVVRPNGHGLRLIRPEAGPGFCGGPNEDPHARGCVSPVWSPDGSRIVFLRDAPKGQQVYTMNADGADVQRVTRGSGYEFVDWGTHPLAR